MKSILLWTALAMLSGQATAQKLPDSLQHASKEQISQFYLQKSKRQQTAALILLGAGTGLIVLGATNKDEGSGFGPSAAQAIPITAGIVSVLVGFPVLAAAERNKKRARLALTTAFIPVTPSFRLQQTGVGFVVPLHGSVHRHRLQSVNP